MRHWNKMKIKNRVAALLLCSSMVMAVPGLKVNATENNSVGTTETQTVEQQQPTNNIIVNTNSNENVNTDANGVLGKNSDVGIEVTKSITGKSGKKVKMSFKVISNNAKTIKLKSIYPVIDNEFPFETSGDAYKVALAGEDEESMKAMDVEFTMTARSDITTGYHSIKYICEYTKLDKDNVETAYYVIKTINIYFTGKSSGNSGSDSGSKGGSTNNTSNTNNTNNSTYNNYYSNGGSDDDDDDYDDDDSDNGGGGSSSSSRGGSGETSAPKLLITGYETKPEKIMAGQKFELVVHIQNTSKSTSVCNGKFLIGNEAGTFLPTSGSNAVFIEKIEPGKIGDLKIELKTGADMAQKTYALIVKGDFDDGKGNTFTSSDSLSVPVYQEVKLGIADVTMTPEMIGIDGEASIMFTINNQGNAGIHNVTVAVAEDQAVTSEGCYVGNIAATSSAYATLPVVGKKDNSDTGKVKIVISYEDAEGNAGTSEQELDCTVGEGIEGDYDMSAEYDEDYEDEEEGGHNWKLIAGIAAVGLGILIILIVVIVAIRKKKAAQLLEDDDFGEDDIENEDF